MPGEFIFIIFGMFVIVFRLMAGSFDGARVEQHIREMGCELIDKSWDPFGPGWFGEKDSRIYQIIYKDCAGRTHRAHVKTSMLSGVYLTNDRVIKEAPKLSVAEEKAALKNRLAQLDKLDPS